MDFLQELNNIGAGKSFKKTVKISELLINSWYSVTDARHIKTKFGQRVIITLNNELSIFLPPRFENISAEQVKDMKKTFFRTYKINSQDPDEFIKCEFINKQQ